MKRFALSQPIRQRLDDAQGLFAALTSAALGFVFLNSAGLMTGQVAGLARILAHLTGQSFGLSFFLMNLPFLALGLWMQGPALVARSFVCVVILSTLVDVLPQYMAFERLSKALAAVAFGVLTGMGLLGVIRHGGSLGGFSLAAVVAQQRWGLRAGYVQLGADLVVFSLAALILPSGAFLWSLVGAAILNLVIAWNHIPGRYNGLLL